MKGSAFSRRVFLKASGGVLMGTLAMASGPIALLAPSRSWAMSLDTLTSRQGQVLLAMTRHIFPHPDLEDAVYALVVKSLDAKAADPQVAALVTDGIDALDREADDDWLALTPDERFALLEARAGTPLFELVRGDAVVSLYDNDLAYAYFGYEGEAGNPGYLTKGFNDLDWLPDPPRPEGGYLPHEVPG